MMKKIIYEEKNPTILARDLTLSNSYIGFEDGHGNRSFLTNTVGINHYSCDLYNISSLGSRSDLEEVYINQAYTLYAFETAYDLMYWVYNMDQE